jgi:hypothetical protein
MMKGPAGRLRLDVRRVWLCPVCQRTERTGGHIVQLRCDCLASNDPPRQTWMTLVGPEPKKKELTGDAPVEPTP